MTGEDPAEYQKLALEMQNYTALLKRRTTLMGKGDRATLPVKPLSSASRGNELAGLSRSGSRFFLMQGSFRAGYSNIKEHERELAKIEKIKERIEYEIVEEPGVIPRTLAIIENILKRVNTVDQQKLEATIDGVNENLDNSRMILGGISTVVNGLVSLGLQYKTFVKIGLAVGAIGILTTLVLIPILMLRIIIFGIT